jgi:hypothetical protein
MRASPLCGTLTPQLAGTTKTMGEFSRVSRLLAVTVSGVGALWLSIGPRSVGAGAVDVQWRSRVSTTLQSVYDNIRLAAGSNSSVTNMARFDAQGRVETDVHYNCSSAAPTVALVSAGLSVSHAAKLPPLCVVEGWIAPASLPTLATVADVTQVRTPSYVRNIARPSLESTAQTQAVTGIDGNAITIMHADQFVSQAGGGGNNVLVGVQSQGIASLSLIQGRSELPNVRVFTSAAGGSASPADEGTALLEEIHAVAPNASLAFCEPQTFVEYTACLQQFANAGATIMVDDIQFLDQDPMTSGGADTQAIGQFLAQNPNVAVFSSGGNDNGSYWEGSYTPVTVASQSLSPLSCNNSTQVDNYVSQFGGGVNQVLTITPTQPISVPLTFSWGDPPGRNASNFDLYWKNSGNPAASNCISISTANTNLVTQSVTLYPGQNNIYIATPDASLAGKFLKLWVGGDGLTALSVSTPGSFVSPQAFAPGVIVVGAVNGSDGVGNNIESFSSRGPISVIFPSPAQLPAPTLVAPDGIKVDAANTYFASVLFPDGNFYGTSAAAPNAAAVAALLRGAFPNLTVAQLLTALESGATQLGASTPDGTFGYGRVDAMGALGTLPAPTMTALSDVSIDASSSTTSAAQPFTVSGTGSLHFTVASTNGTLIPATVAASSTAGVAVSPSGCGSTTLTCSLTVTAAQYQGGTATVTVSAVDGAGRAAPATMHVTVNNPQTAPPPPPTTASSGGSGHGGGGSLDWWEILAAAVLVLWRANALQTGFKSRPPTHPGRD